jgi:vanillate O-demethylase ferredoxin subunit
MNASSPLSLTLRVAEVRELNPHIRMFRFMHPGGQALPGWTPGAHVKVRVELPDGSADLRHYSLIELEGLAGAPGFSPACYTIAVRRDPAGRGGSVYMHDRLHAGVTVEVEAPRNDFELKPATGTTVLLAGGIGITPLASMAARCRAIGRPVKLVYAGRSRDSMALLPELQALLGEDLQVHADAEANGAIFDVDGFLDGLAPDDHLYVCGPKPLLDRVLQASERRQWAPGRLHFELFSSPVLETGDQPFEVELAQSGQTFEVPVGQSILDCLIEHGCDPLFDCKRGECGVCATPVLSGEPDHRDYVLSRAEKDSGKVIQICVSRAKGRKIVLDI